MCWTYNVFCLKFPLKFLKFKKTKEKMKKLLLILAAMLVVFSVSAESLWFNAYSYAYKYKTDAKRNNQSGWSSNVKCSVPIEFDMDNDLVVIYSNKTQIYAIYEDAGEYTDSEGGKQKGFYVIDQDYDKGMVRLRIARDGTSQLYIDFNDVGWVYNVVRTTK